MEQYTVRRKNIGTSDNPYYSLTIVAEGYDYRKLFINIGEDCLDRIVTKEKNGIVSVFIHYRYYFTSEEFNNYCEVVNFKNRDLAHRFIEELENA